MWKQIAYFELKQGFRKISLWVYFLIFFAIACLIAHVLGGAFTGASMGNQGAKINSPLMIAEFQVVFSLIGGVGWGIVVLMYLGVLIYKPSF